MRCKLDCHPPEWFTPPSDFENKTRQPGGSTFYKLSTPRQTLAIWGLFFYGRASASSRTNPSQNPSTMDFELAVESPLLAKPGRGRSGRGSAVAWIGSFRVILKTKRGNREAALFTSWAGHMSHTSYMRSIFYGRLSARSPPLSEDMLCLKKIQNSPRPCWGNAGCALCRFLCVLFCCTAAILLLLMFEGPADRTARRQKKINAKSIN